MRGTAAKTGILYFVNSFTGLLRTVGRMVAMLGYAVTRHAIAPETPVRPTGVTPTGVTNMANEGQTPPRLPPSLAVPESSMDGRAVMYVQTVFWVASYVRNRAKQGDVTQEQLIEEFGVNVRNAIDPDWRPQG